MVEDSEDGGEAIRRLMERLEVDEMCCRVILDMQVKRFTRERRWLIASSAYLRRNQAAGQTLLTRWAGWLYF